jgi:hypothetical protein
MPAAKNSDVVEHARRLWLTLPHEERAVRKLAARLREQGIKVGKSTIAEWVRKWDQEHAVAQTLPDQLVSAIANGQSLAAVEQSLAVAAAEVTRRLRAGGDIKVLIRCVAVCAGAYRDLAEGARHRVETDLIVARNRAERARDVTPAADAEEDSDKLAVYAEFERMDREEEDEVRNAVIGLVRDGKWAAKDGIAMLRRLLVEAFGGRYVCPDTLARIVLQLQCETGESEVTFRE